MMPKVGNKKYPYTTKGKAAAKRAAKTTDKLPIVGVSLPGIKREGLKGRPPRERYVFLREDIFHAFWKDYLQEAK